MKQEISNINYMYRYRNNETEKDYYEYSKMIALKIDQLPQFNKKNILGMLEEVYLNNFTDRVVVRNNGPRN